MQNDYQKYLIPNVIARLSNMELRAKLVVEGFMAGLHKSPYHGFSVEFAEHRQYIPGDDLKFLDWKIFARTERYYIKQFEEETNLKSYICLDVSKSMDFSSQSSKGEQTVKTKTKNLFKKVLNKSFESTAKNSDGIITKLEYASYLAASLAYLMLMQRDAISLTTYDVKRQNYIPPRATPNNLRQILNALASVQPSNQTGTANSLNEIASGIKRRGLVIVLSDLFDEPEEVVKSLKHFRFMNNEVIVFQILDPIEMNFLEGNPVTLIDMETKEEMYSQPFAIQKAYKETIKEFLENYKSQLKNNGIDYQVLSTETPFDKALLTYLSKRAKLN
jgi:uncharacterized protein (DUF58 family)